MTKATSTRWGLSFAFLFGACTANAAGASKASILDSYFMSLSKAAGEADGADQACNSSSSGSYRSALDAKLQNLTEEEKKRYFDSYSFSNKMGKFEADTERGS